MLKKEKKIDVFVLYFQSQPGEVGQAVKDAIDIGYRHFDCAHIYLNEKEIGEALNEKIKEGAVKRDGLFITSKVLLSIFYREFHLELHSILIEDLLSHFLLYVLSPCVCYTPCLLIS